MRSGLTTSTVPPDEIRRWRAVQITLWIVGVAMVASLLFAPAIGIRAFWDILIPLAPALLVVSPGLWRNSCPLATTVLFPRHLNFSARKRPSPRTQSILQFSSLILLLTVVPLRHVVLDASGPVTAVTLIVLAVTGFVLGLSFEWKSAWCAGLCPIFHVEKLYGANPVHVPVNAHCTLCEQCVVPCPDSTRAMTPLKTRNDVLHKLTGRLLLGGFPGFVWGWFQVRDYSGTSGWYHLAEVYAWPLGGLIVSLLLFMLLDRILPNRYRSMLPRLFAFGAVACYYWFRIPMLAGFGPHPGYGILVDLKGTLPFWFPAASHAITTGLFFWLLLVRSDNDKHPWTWRPPFAGTG